MAKGQDPMPMVAAVSLSRYLERNHTDKHQMGLGDQGIMKNLPGLPTMTDYELRTCLYPSEMAPS
jgi:hypothetical protein